MATVTKGRTFVSGETVTPAKLNDLVDNATVTAIQTADIADSQITSAKIADGTIVNADVSASAAIAYSKLNLANSIVAGDIASDAVTTAKILNANVTPAKLSQPFTLDTAKASTSGTTIEFTGIPSWARRLTVMFNGVSTNAASAFLIQVGAGSFTTTGYACGAMSIEGANTASVTSSGAGFLVLRATVGAAAASVTGHLVVTNISGNTWVGSGAMIRTDNGAGTVCSGSIALGGALDRVRVTTSNGTDVFDAGSINIFYEG